MNKRPNRFYANRFERYGKKKNQVKNLPTAYLPHDKIFLIYKAQSAKRIAYLRDHSKRFFNKETHVKRANGGKEGRTETRKEKRFHK